MSGIISPLGPCRRSARQDWCDAVFQVGSGHQIDRFLIGRHFGEFFRGQARVDFQVVTGGVAQPEFMEGRAPPCGAGWLDDLGRC